MKSTKKIGRDKKLDKSFALFAKRLASISVADSINWNAFRRSWLESARQTSIGILLFNFVPKTWDYPQTLGSIIDANPKIKKRFERWVNAKKPTFPNCLMGDRLAYMLRK